MTSTAKSTFRMVAEFIVGAVASDTQLLPA